MLFARKAYHFHFQVHPAGARIGPDLVRFEAQGRWLPPEDYTLHPDRVVLRIWRRPTQPLTCKEEARGS
jgi:hypothetical protein